MFARTPHSVCGGSGSEDVPEWAGASTGLGCAARHSQGSWVQRARSSRNAARRVLLASYGTGGNRLLWGAWSHPRALGTLASPSRTWSGQPRGWFVPTL